MHDASFRTPLETRRQLTVTLEGNKGISSTVFHDEYNEDQTMEDLMSFIETSFLQPEQQVVEMQWVREESLKALAPCHRIHDIPNKTYSRCRIPDPFEGEVPGENQTEEWPPVQSETEYMSPNATPVCSPRKEKAERDEDR